MRFFFFSVLVIELATNVAFISVLFSYSILLHMYVFLWAMLPELNKYRITYVIYTVNHKKVAVHL